MQIIYTKSYDNTAKKLKKYPKEIQILKEIITYIETSNNFQELKTNPIKNLYGFEQLKYQNNKFYSFNLEKNGGTKRLIVLPANESKIYLIFISYDHYKDFSEERIIYYDE